MITGGAAIFGVLLTIPLSSIPFVQFALLRLLEMIGVRKKRKPWGVVYDSATKQPVQMAIVRIYNAETNELKGTSVIDEMGRYSFLVQPGNYYLKVSHPNFSWPSKQIKGVQDDIYSDLYHGEVFNVTEDNPVVNKNIPVDPADERSKKLSFRKIRFAVQKVLLPILILSLLIDTYLFILSHDPSYLIISLLLFGLITKDLLYRRQKLRWGTVYDSITKKPVSGALVRIFDAEYKQEKKRTITDQNGRYGFLVPNGKYIVSVQMPNYSFPTNMIRFKNDLPYYHIYHGEEIIKETQDSLITLNIPIDQQ